MPRPVGAIAPSGNRETHLRRGRVRVEGGVRVRVRVRVGVRG